MIVVNKIDAESSDLAAGRTYQESFGKECCRKPDGSRQPRRRLFFSIRPVKRIFFGGVRTPSP
jgi:hypothetical protein